MGDIQSMHNLTRQDNMNYFFLMNDFINAEKLRASFDATIPAIWSTFFTPKILKMEVE